MTPQRRCAVVGRPVVHSLSPVMHRAAYGVLGLPWTYDAIELADGELAVFADGLDDAWRGLSVTMPFKREAAAFADHRTDDVVFLGVANTLVREEDGWYASNTDVPGAVLALREAGVERVETVRMLGAGATAASLVLAASRLGARSVELLVRDPARASEVAAVARELALEVEIVEVTASPDTAVDLLVNTIPAAAVRGREHALVGAATGVFEAIYDPWPTPLLSAAQEEGLATATGLDLLAHQAVLQLLAMTGEAVAPDVLREAALDALGA
ncbi:shikimate dehydrogenase [Aeromicrobium sp. PE09-221]|nr:shikimate dehydrogenase [Aeromicrobium sp. PE09-221]